MNPSSSFNQFISSGNDDVDFESELLAIASTSDTTIKADDSYTDAKFYDPSTFNGMGNFRANKRRKLGVQYEALKDDVERPQIFKRLSIYINGFVEGAIGYRQLTQILTLGGGKYISYLDRKSSITHIIAAVLTPKKRAEFVNYKVATPTWLTESWEKGVLLDWRQYKESDATSSHDSRIGEADRMGTQVAQKSLFSMGVSVKGMEKEGVSSFNDDSEPISPRAALPSSSTPDTPFTSVSPPIIPSPAKPAPIPVNYNLETYAPYLPTKGQGAAKSALLQDLVWMSKHTSSSSGYIAEYFKQSRLHYLSTWKQELLLLVGAKQVDVSRPVRTKKLTGTEADGRTIMHCDFDSFFVACGLISRPELVGKPIAVCHAKGETLDSESSTSEIACASYEARKFGVEAGMTFGRARELCPELKAIPFEFELYRSISAAFYEIMLRHSDLTQAVSVDEAIIDVSSKFLKNRKEGAAFDFAQQIRAEVKAATGCELSIGISHNILLARLATRSAKPANAYHLRPNLVENFLAPLSLDALPGIGWKSRDKIEEGLKVKTVGELSAVRRSEMVRVLGKVDGVKFENYSRGIDDTELRVGEKRQSVSAEVNYGIRFTESDKVKEFVLLLGIEVATRLKSFGGLKARSITLKLKLRHPDAAEETPKFLGHGHVVDSSYSANIAGARNVATDDGEVIGAAAWKILASLDIPPKELRGIAIQASKLETNGVPNDLVIERGQGLLKFGVVAKDSFIVEDEVEDDATEFDNLLSSLPLDDDDDILLPLPPPQQVQLSTVALSMPIKIPVPRTLTSIEEVIILSSSPESDSSSSRLPLPINPVKISNKPVSRIARMFQSQKSTTKSSFPTASQVSDQQLDELGLQADVFRELPRDIQDEQLSNVFRTSRGLEVMRGGGKQMKKKGVKVEEGQSRLRGQSSKPSLDPVIVKKSNRPVAVVKDPALSPTTITVDQLLELDKNLDVDAFRELPATIQREQIVEYTRMKKSLSVAGVVRTSMSKPSEPIKLVGLKVVAAPEFYGQSSLEGIRSLLENWFESNRDAEPNEDDVKVVWKFLQKCLDRRLGQDLHKVTAILSWWRCLIEWEFGTTGGVDKIGNTWWNVYNDVKRRVDLVVLKESGSALS